MARRGATGHQHLLPGFLVVAATSAAPGARQRCPLRSIDVRAFKGFDDFRVELGEDEAPQPVKLIGVTEGWALLNWTLTDLVERVGATEVWPRDVRSVEPPRAARTVPMTLAGFISEEPSELSVFETSFCPLTRAFEGAYTIPRPFQWKIRASPLASFTRRGSGVGFHAAYAGFALWVAQVRGSTTWALLYGDVKTRMRWPWPNDAEAIGEPSSVGISCTLEEGEALFVPRGYAYAFRGEDDTNVILGWQGEMRPMGELEIPIAAIAAGDVEAFSSAAEKFPLAGARNSVLGPCVNQAMQSGHLAILKALQKMGAVFDEETPAGATHLHQAATAGQAEAIRFAIQDGADPAVKHSKEGTYPIHHAAHAGHAAVTEVLLEKAKNCWKLKDPQGRQALHIAALHGHTATVEALVRKRASTSAQDRTKFQPLHWAVEGNQPGIIRHLLAGRADLEARTMDGETAFHRAAVKGHTAILTELLNLRAGLESRRLPGGQTAVHIAAYVGHVSVLELLHERGANMNPKKKQGEYTLEGLAASAGHDRVLEYLRKVSKNKLDLETRDVPVHAAIQAGHVAVLRKLLDGEVSIGPPIQRRFQLAIAAAKAGHVNVVEFLLDNGKLIREHGSEGILMQAAASKGHEAVISLLAENKVHVDAKDVKGDRPIAHAAAEGHAGAVRKLLELRADPQHRSDKGKTALHLAVVNGHAPAVKALLEAGTPLQAEDAQSASANSTGREHLHVAASAGHKAVAEVLLDHDADVMVQDRIGVVPSFLAAERGHVPVMQLLVQRRADPMHRVAMQNPNASGNESQAVEASALAIAGNKGHIPFISYLAKDLTLDATRQLVRSLGELHGKEWEAKLEVALKLPTREETARDFRQTMADPDKRKRMEEFNEMYSKLSPKERAVIDNQIKDRVEEREAKAKHAERERRKQKNRLAEL